MPRIGSSSTGIALSVVSAPSVDKGSSTGLSPKNLLERKGFGVAKLTIVVQSTIELCLLS